MSLRFECKCGEKFKSAMSLRAHLIVGRPIDPNSFALRNLPRALRELIEGEWKTYHIRHGALECLPVDNSNVPNIDNY